MRHLDTPAGARSLIEQTGGYRAPHKNSALVSSPAKRVYRDTNASRLVHACALDQAYSISHSGSLRNLDSLCRMVWRAR